MPRQLNLKALVCPDLVWTDSAGNEWIVAGDVSVATAFKLFGLLEDFADPEADHIAVLDELQAAVRALFQTRHSENDLAGLRFPADYAPRLVAGLLNALTGDLGLQMKDQPGNEGVVDVLTWFLALMRGSEGAMSHEDILRLPYRTFVGYLLVLGREADEAEMLHAARGNRAMVDEYRQHIGEWRRRQPPPN